MWSSVYLFRVIQAEENVGMAMVFTIISAVQEKLDIIVQKTAEDKVSERERQKQDEEERERVRGSLRSS